MTVGEGISIGLGFLAIVAPDFWPRMPRPLSYALAMIGLAWLTYSGILAIEDYSQMKLEYGPLGAIIIGAIFVAGGLFWHISRIPPKHERSPLGPTIFAECHHGLMPKQAPPDGRFYVWNLFPTPIANGGGGLAEYFAQSGSEMNWPTAKGGIPLSAYRCVLTNYGTAPIFNVRFDPTMTFRPLIPRKDNPDVGDSGPISLSRTWPLFIAKIDAGAGNPFVFYIFNTTDNFVDVALPDNGTTEVLGEIGAKPLKIISPSGLVSLGPFNPEPPK